MREATGRLATVPYFIVFLVAAVAGVVVGYATIRTGRAAPGNPETWTETYREDAPSGAAARGTQQTKRPLPPDPDAHTRTAGAAGLLGVVLIGAGVIALFALLLWNALEGVFS